MNIQYLKHSESGNCKRSIINEAIEMAEHNLYCYSANINGTKAKTGYEKEWCNTKEKLTVLNQIYNELPDEEGYCIYIGSIKERFVSDGRCYVKFVLLSPDTEKPQTYYFKYHLVVNLKFEVMPSKTNDLMLGGIVAIRVKDGTIEQIHYLEKGEN